MCNEALGTFVGRFHNFSREGDKVIADLHISDTANDSPKGELGSYLLKMAESESAMFGTSIVFTPGNLYRRGDDGGKYQYNVKETSWGVDHWYTNEAGHKLSEDEIDEAKLSDELYVECESLHACDAVDEPAANEGLFSTDAFGQGELAAQITEFLDLHPQISKFAESNPNLIQQFLSRYSANSSPEHNNTQETFMSDAANKEVEEVVTEPAALSTPEVEPAAEAAPAVEPEPAPEPEALSDEPVAVSDLQRAVAEFGAVIATEAFGAGGGYDESRELHFAAIQKENEQLKAGKDAGGADPIPMGEGNEKPNKIWKNL